MADEWQGSDRREHPRVPMDGEVRGKIESRIEAPLVDLSLSGALIEIVSALPASEMYRLRLPLDKGGMLELRAEVVRSYVHGFDTQGAGKPKVKYRAALRFLDLDDEQKKGLESLLERGRDDRIQIDITQEGG